MRNVSDTQFMGVGGLITHHMRYQSTGKYTRYPSPEATAGTPEAQSRSRVAAFFLSMFPCSDVHPGA
jgi:hypothetical protein